MYCGVIFSYDLCQEGFAGKDIMLFVAVVVPGSVVYKMIDSARCQDYVESSRPGFKWKGKQFEGKQAYYQ